MGVKPIFFINMPLVKNKIARQIVTNVYNQTGVIMLFEPTSGNTGIALAFFCAIKLYEDAFKPAEDSISRSFSISSPDSVR